MRDYIEPTARNLLRRPLVFGVPLLGLASIALMTLAISTVFSTHRFGNLAATCFGLVSFGVLRAISRFAKVGWEERPIWALEKRLCPKIADGSRTIISSQIEVVSPDTLDEPSLIAIKDSLRERLAALKAGQRLTFALKMNEAGGQLFELQLCGRFDLSTRNALAEATSGLIPPNGVVFSLYQLPVWTDPLWTFSVLSRFSGPVTAFVTFRGTNHAETKRRVEVARRSNSGGSRSVSDIDSEISFEEASQVLRGLSRGDEGVLEASLVLVASQDGVSTQVDDSLLVLEKEPDLALAAVLGLRKRLHRSHHVRLVTACDLVPNVADPIEVGASILSTVRGKPLYFSPNDPRLEALHWLVVGASGSGKSFFTGLVLKRMIEGGTPMSVLFVDHNRSFRRLVHAFGSDYAEPKAFEQLERATLSILDHLEQPGQMIGIELSDLDQAEKKAGIGLILRKVETFLRFRDSTHPIYVVLDECWNFMRDEPVLVQRAFREFRKLNGAAIAITQSLSDFLTDESGQSIFQNAPVRILLRQGEDLGRYQGVLNLNEVELGKVRSLRQQKGVYSECLIKTPFLSRFGRLYTTDEEHALLRTDNLREELIAESRGRKAECSASH